jgi:hypothetical protein
VGQRNLPVPTLLSARRNHLKSCSLYCGNALERSGRLGAEIRITQITATYQADWEGHNGLEAAFVQHGMDSVVLQEERQEVFRANDMITNLIQGFMGLGLV